MMDWLVENWFWVLIGIVFVGMHFFGHGGHGGAEGDEDTLATASSEEEKNQAGKSHHH